MKKILYIQFRDDISATHEEKCVADKFLPDKSSLTTLNSIKDEINISPGNIPESYSAIILGGSGQYDLSKKPENLMQGISKVRPILDFVLEKDFPMFGICMGFQILGHILGGEIKADSKYSENGVKRVFLVNNKCDILKDIPSAFLAMQAHKDSLVGVPRVGNFQILARSKKGLTEIFRYKKNIYATQFHPELEKKDIIYRWGLYPDYLKGKSEDEIKEMKDAIKPTPYATKILKNFIDYYC